MDTSGWVSLKYIVANIKSRLMTDDKFDEYLLQYCIDGITEMNMFHLDISGPKTTVLTISDINTVALPQDYIDYLQIGIIVNGQIRTLSLNPQIPIPITMDCGEDTNGFSDLIRAYPASPQFGAGGGYNVSEYKIDKRGRRIVLQGAVPGGQVIMEYISSGISLSEENYFPRKYLPVIRAYVMWVLADNDPKVQIQEKMRKGKILQEEVMRVSMSEMPTISEMVDVIRSGYRQTPKR